MTMSIPTSLFESPSLLPQLDSKGASPSFFLQSFYHTMFCFHLTDPELIKMKPRDERQTNICALCGSVTYSVNAASYSHQGILYEEVEI